MPGQENARLYEQTRRAEEVLQESESKFRALSETIPAALFIIQGSKIRYMNPASEAMTGYTRDELQSGNFWDVIHPEFQELIRERGKARQTGEQVPPRNELKLLTKDGGERWIDFAATLIEYEGQPAFDITERKAAEEALRESEERFRQMAENLKEVFFMVDHKNYNVLYVNSAFEEIWGLPCESLYELPAIWLSLIQPEDRERVKAALEKQQITGEFNEEFRIIRPDGSVHWISDQAFPIRNEVGEIYRLVGIAEDITHRKQAEDALREGETKIRQQARELMLANAELTKANQTKGEFRSFGSFVSYLNLFQPVGIATSTTGAGRPDAVPAKDPVPPLSQRASDSLLSAQVFPATPVFQQEVLIPNYGQHVLGGDRQGLKPFPPGLTQDHPLPAFGVLDPLSSPIAEEPGNSRNSQNSPHDSGPLLEPFLGGLFE